MPPTQAGRRGPAAAKKRKLEAVGTNAEPKKAKRGPGRPPKKKKPVVVAVKAPAPEPETEPRVTADPETANFVQLLEDDACLLPPPPPLLPKRRGSAKSPPEKRVVEFQLPFKEAEIKSLEERQWVRRPPPFGKINRCVYVSTKMPIADFPVHKCTCCEETHKSMTKRTTMMASAKAQKELVGKDHCPLTRHADLEKQHEMENMVYCGEGCYNRMLFISCSDETCSAPDPSMCSNRAIKRRELKSVRVDYIPGPGFGLIANEKINAGEFIIEYVGEVIDDKECERRMIKYRDNGEVNFYMMELEKNIVIDAKYRSNESRFINHSCDPNSVTQKWNVDGMQRIGIFARRDIAPIEEITIDYNFSHFGEAADCKCGSTACTGKIGLKRSKMPSFNSRVVGTTRTKKHVPVDEEPPELKRPVHLTSLALLKSSQMDDSWLEYYGFKNRRLFLSHQTRRSKKVDGDTKVEIRRSPPSSSPASECSTTTEEDVSLTPPQTVQSTPIERKLRRRSWYEKVVAGEHLPEMRALHSYICGGRSDWTADLTADLTAGFILVAASPSPVKKRGPGRPPKKRGRPKKVVPMLRQTKRTPLGTKLAHRRLGLSQARSRGIDELAAFAIGKSKWNKRVPSSSSIDPDRIHRLIDRVQGKQFYINTDQNDLNEDACFRCGLAGELICCDGCPAAFHLNCTNLAMVPPDGIPWFCSECTNPKHLQKSSKASDAAIIAARGTRSSSGGATPTNYAGRHLRTHAAQQVPSLKKIFHVSAPHTKRRYKKRHKATARSYRELEHMPLPAWNESDDSEAEQ
ncbi:Histone-lysine N-methyltransferase NSD3 [Phytophthora pseudosyringae]|uniref:Histone-lysine N-methyltransferase NSD3 n=1 Tax=Phytophthora pseudosyringae TaxID=221518 RepID=A0A8T1WPJ7_9STRA|nr:Histone-lysine N-methyltransferase NSD3 [Phytophthora pseudosyringae]